MGQYVIVYRIPGGGNAVFDTAYSPAAAVRAVQRCHAKYGPAAFARQMPAESIPDSMIKANPALPPMPAV